MRGQELLSYEASLRWFSLKKRRLWEDLIEAFQYLKGAYKKAGDELFTRAYGFKLEKNPTWSAASSSGAPAWEGHGTDGVSPEEATKMIGEVEHRSCEEKLGELRLFRAGEDFEVT
ncbi:hypothetical protein DUI87_09071 [Hirundo rustica rustica]|uniref:Uncharacterized protein n=1 Tax=Hirundo rustica rustica TaxID=333673 RepID=A0A3M0L3P7_HIRRU|nr:hypothetical protein DUI87_09071 [Hirundo rustica rustica]